ncbi:unnamed protein product [Caenorhabditis auriculariae]|uniref:Potassium channel domain-containing protein n=1 Tax=Caenorhabditis auriculariae TaxID=2777116 RepID=A0A8S1GVP2_9PELO|nr:unnamed protein product [Caenorhabditis auriculariae]
MLSDHSAAVTPSASSAHHFSFENTSDYPVVELPPKHDPENPFSVALHSPSALPSPPRKQKNVERTPTPTANEDMSLEIQPSQKSSRHTDVPPPLVANLIATKNMNIVERLRVKLQIGNELMRATLAECFCTGFLIFGGECTNAQFVLSQRKNNEFICVTIGWAFSLVIAVTMGARISGAHLNPAVSFFQLTQGKIPPIRFVMFVIAQNVGAFFGAMFTFMVYYDAIDAFDKGVRNVSGPAATASIFATYPGPHLSTFGGVIDQVVGTMVLCMGIAAIVDRRNRIPPFLQPAFLGCLLALIGMSLCLNAGYAINPARDFAPRLFTLMAGYGWRVFSYRNYKWFWIPIICPMIGALLGAWLYEFFIGFHIPDDPETTFIHKILDDRNPDGQIREVHVVEKKPLSEVVANDEPTSYRNIGPKASGVIHERYGEPLPRDHLRAILALQTRHNRLCPLPLMLSPSNVPDRPFSRVNRLRQSFRDKAQLVKDDVRQGLQRVRKTPRWLRILRKIYHDYGLKHVCLISLLVLYQFIGAGIFYFCEAGYDEDKEKLWKARISSNRTNFVNEIVPKLFNNTRYLFFLSDEQTNEVSEVLHEMVENYETQLGIKYTDQKIKWDFWNAMLYAQTICTTIGYGHLYPSTVPGRLFTMVYAIFGIPLVLSILDDLGKLLTRCLKTPWWLLKCACRRAFRYCTKQTLAEIRKLDDDDRRDLEIFDLPIPIAIFVVVAWIFICSATFCIWESDWDYFVAFYFFFISLSTIGLGDITPTQPKYLLMLFIYIIIGLSLVSMCINLIQAKLERTYDAGRVIEIMSIDHGTAALVVPAGADIRRRGSSLGIFRSSSSVHSLTREAVQSALVSRKKSNKTVQTVLSFPSSCTSISRTVTSSRLKFLPRTLSIDDVMRMVDTEDGDILVLTDLIREESTLSQISKNSMSSDGSSSQIVVSKSFDANFTPTPANRVHIATSHSDPSTASTIPANLTVRDIEELEELEDRIALGQTSSSLANTVHFRSRLSLIPEQLPSTVEEGEEPSEESNPLSPDENIEPNNKRRGLQTVFGGFFSRKKSEPLPEKLEENDISTSS